MKKNIKVAQKIDFLICRDYKAFLVFMTSFLCVTAIFYAVMHFIAKNSALAGQVYLPPAISAMKSSQERPLQAQAVQQQLPTNQAEQLAQEMAQKQAQEMAHALAQAVPPASQVEPYVPTPTSAYANAPIHSESSSKKPKMEQYLVAEAFDVSAANPSAPINFSVTTTINNPQTQTVTAPVHVSQQASPVISNVAPPSQTGYLPRSSYGQVRGTPNVERDMYLNSAYENLVPRQRIYSDPARVGNKTTLETRVGSNLAVVKVSSASPPNNLAYRNLTDPGWFKRRSAEKSDRYIEERARKYQKIQVEEYRPIYPANYPSGYNTRYSQLNYSNNLPSRVSIAPTPSTPKPAQRATAPRAQATAPKTQATAPKAQATPKPTPVVATKVTTLCAECGKSIAVTNCPTCSGAPVQKVPVASGTNISIKAGEHVTVWAEENEKTLQELETLVKEKEKALQELQTLKNRLTEQGQPLPQIQVQPTPPQALQAPGLDPLYVSPETVIANKIQQNAQANQNAQKTINDTDFSQPFVPTIPNSATTAPSEIIVPVPSNLPVSTLSVEPNFGA